MKILVVSISKFVVLLILMVFIVDWAQYREKRRVITDSIQKSEETLLLLKEEDSKLKELLRYFRQEWDDHYYFNLLQEALPCNVVLTKVKASYQGYMDISGRAENYDAIEKFMSFFASRKRFVSLLQVDKKINQSRTYFVFTLRIWN